MATQFAPSQPPPPADASPARAALLARGDAVCMSDYDLLAKTTRRLQSALRRLASQRTVENRRAVGELIVEFTDRLEHTHAVLSAFRAPPDGRETLRAYLAALVSQIDLLDRARAALLHARMRAYDRLGDEIRALGTQAERQARNYGFVSCSAARFS